MNFVSGAERQVRDRFLGLWGRRDVSIIRPPRFEGIILA